jgi:ABC-type nitrate/sulfonate/bicarbonate transport system substrate-binding protein
LAVTLSFWLGIAQANPYIAKPGEAPLRLRIATCSVTGGFVHLYTALENNLFDKYGFKLEHIYIRGTGPSLAALIADEIQFLHCAADATLPSRRRVGRQSGVGYERSLALRSSPSKKDFSLWAK